MTDGELLIKQIIEILDYKMDDLRGELKSDIHNLKVDFQQLRSDTKERDTETRETFKKSCNDVQQLVREIKSDYVTKDAFLPVNKIVWGTLLAVLGVIVKMILE